MNLIDKLKEAINNDDILAKSILIDMLLRDHTEDELVTMLKDSDLLDNTCYFCDIKCDNKECTLVPKSKEK